MTASDVLESPSTWAHAKRSWQSRALLSWGRPVEYFVLKNFHPENAISEDAIGRDLIESIHAKGFQQPLFLEQVEYSKYVIVDGHRRLGAARLLSRECVPAIIIGDGSDSLLLRQIFASTPEFVPSEIPKFLQLLEAMLGYATSDLSNDLGSMVPELPCTHRTSRQMMLTQALEPLHLASILVLAAFTHAKPLFQQALLDGTLDESELIELVLHPDTTSQELAQIVRARIEACIEVTATHKIKPMALQYMRDTLQMLESDPTYPDDSSEGSLISLLKFAGGALETMKRYEVVATFETPDALSQSRQAFSSMDDATRARVLKLIGSVGQKQSAHE